MSESRIASYIGIAKGEIPPRHYFGAWRSFPDTCDYSFQETKPLGYSRLLFGEDVFEGAYPYAGTRITPSWGGSMFEALMPPLFVPEDLWAPGSTPTASSPRTPRSSHCAGRRAGRFETSRGSSATSRTPTTAGASATR